MSKQSNTTRGEPPRLKLVAVASEQSAVERACQLIDKYICEKWPEVPSADANHTLRRVLIKSALMSAHEGDRMAASPRNDAPLQCYPACLEDRRQRYRDF